MSNVVHSIIDMFKFRQLGQTKSLVYIVSNQHDHSDDTFITRQESGLEIKGSLWPINFSMASEIIERISLVGPCLLIPKRTDLISSYSTKPEFALPPNLPMSFT